jgi:RING finger family protein
MTALRCSICHTLIQPADATTICPECTQVYHEPCWREIGGCGTYGCKSAAVAEKPPVPVLVGAGWGDEKECPACGQAIASSLLACACGARFPWADPMTRPEYQEWSQSQRRVRRTKRILLGLFAISLLGVTAPLLGPIAGAYAHRHRVRLGGHAGTYLAMGYGNAVLGATYAAILIFLALGR